MNTCDRAQVWTTSHCNDQAEPRLVVKRMRFADGNATGETTSTAVVAARSSCAAVG